MNSFTEPLPFLFGAQYYRAPTPGPEAWEKDFRTMRDLGFNAVKFWVQWRWSHIETEQFDFSDIKSLMDLAHAHGLRVTLNTIFDVSPLWLFDVYPDAKKICADGSTVEPRAVDCRQIGGVPGPCYNHPGAKNDRRRFLAKVVQEFAGHPAMSMWDVWNEPEQCMPYRHPRMEKTVCYCLNCRRGFSTWLQNKYGSVDQLNRVWGRCYRSWDQIEAPLTPSASFTDLIDWREFHLDSMTSEASWRLDLVKELDKIHVAYLHVVPHTLRPFNSVTGVDDFALAKKCDVFAGTTFAGSVFSTQLMSAAGGKTVYNVESHVNHGQIGMHPPIIKEENLKREFIPQVGIGIRGFLFWQFRAESLGGESPAWGIVRGDGSVRPATAAAQSFWSTLRIHADRLMKIRGEDPQVAIWKSRKNELFHFGHGALENLADGLDAYTDHFYWRSIPCRYIDCFMLEGDALLDESMRSIRLLVMPNPYYVTQGEADALDRWVRSGGVVLTEAHLGGYDGTKGRHSGVLPGCSLAEKWDIREIESTASVHLDRSLDSTDHSGPLIDEVRKALAHFGSTGGRYFPVQHTGGYIIAGCDRFVMLESADAQVVATYGEGASILIKKQVGAGLVFYCGTNIGCGAMKAPEGFSLFLDSIARESGVAPALAATVQSGGPVRFDPIGGTSESPDYIAVYNRGDSTSVVHLRGIGVYRDAFSGAVLKLDAETELPARFAGLFVRE